MDADPSALGGLGIAVNSRFYQRPGFFFLLFALFLGALLLSEMVPFWGEKATMGRRENPHSVGPRYEFPTNFELAAKNPKMAESIQLGAEIFYQTPKFASNYVGNGLSCNSCHFQGGTQQGMLGLVGVALKYPEFDPRAGRLVTLQERLQSCFLRSLNGKAPAEGSAILQNLFDYVSYLSTDVSKDQVLEWRSLDWIPVSEKIPIDKLDPEAGRALFAKNCSACHGPRGDGDGWAPALWGEKTFNEGSGLARVYTLAGFLYRAMPLSAPNRLSLEQAQQVAAYLDAMPRPAYSGMAQDYPNGDIPVDAVYYSKKYPRNPLAESLKVEEKLPGQ